jgi:hypothetical protein
MDIISRAEAKEQGLKKYFTGKPCIRGHISDRYIKGHCTCCARLWRKENKSKTAPYNKKYREENKGRAALVHKLYYKENKDKVNAIRKRYYKENKDKASMYRKRHAEGNKDKVALYKKQWRTKNPLIIFTRSSLQRIERAVGYDRIVRAEIEIGYTQKEFINHIESLWVDGMSWDNRSDWHIDHIKPLSLFIKEGVADPVIINALSNLQPLWAKDNLSKGAKYNETN